MGAHKIKEAAVDDMIDTMHKTRVSHVKVMHVLHESVGGLQNLSITERNVTFKTGIAVVYKNLCAVFMFKND
jgi:hypothetical protein